MRNRRTTPPVKTQQLRRTWRRRCYPKRTFLLIHAADTRSLHPGARRAAQNRNNQHQDTGAKVHHLASNTTSNILSKSISKDGGRTSYRGLVNVSRKAENCRSNIVCDALLMDEKSQSDTYPTMEVSNSSAHTEHEASVSKVSDEQLFYLMSRGHTESEAKVLIVNGFFEPFTKELPMEYAVELNKLLELEMVGSIG